MLLCKCLNFSDTSSKWEPNANQRRFLVCVLNPLGESEFSDLCEAIRNSRLDGKNCFKLLEELVEVPAEDAEHWDELLNTPWGLVYEQEESEAAQPDPEIKLNSEGIKKIFRVFEQFHKVLKIKPKLNIFETNII